MVLLEILHFLGKCLECDCPICLVRHVENPCVGKVQLNCKEEGDPACLTLKTPKRCGKEAGVSYDVFGVTFWLVTNSLFS